MENEIKYTWLPGTYACLNDQLMEACSVLYSGHYGSWGPKGNRPGKSIALSPDKIRTWIENENSFLYYAEYDHILIGYAIAVNLEVKDYGIISWVTQLVVHKDYRNRGIAKNILYSIWGLSDHFAWGIISANPFAVRALEKTTRRRSIPLRIKKNVRKLKNLGEANIPYISSNTEIRISEASSIINTRFFVDHSNVNKMIEKVASEEAPWILGFLEEGEEWFAFTFRDQDQIHLNSSEIANMVKTSDQVARLAYSRMDVLSCPQPWMRHTAQEVSFIIEQCGLTEGSSVIDFGCGTGRHSLCLADEKLSCVGVDYVKKNIEFATSQAKKERLENVVFIEGDCRNITLDVADAVICLYDVIGSFAEDKENLEILRNIYRHLKQGGRAVISVMNYSFTSCNAKKTFDFSKEADLLLELPASNTQETTGNIFNPDYYLVDSTTHLVYRKEQFTIGRELPIELIVRDRRYEMSEIKAMCEFVGLHVITARYVNAASWNAELSMTAPGAKEILLVCEK